MWVLYPCQIGIWSGGFCGGRKTEKPREKLMEPCHARQARNNNKRNSHMHIPQFLFIGSSQSGEEKHWMQNTLSKDRTAERTKSRAHNFCGSSLKGRLFQDLQKLFPPEIKKISAEDYSKLSLVVYENPTGKSWPCSNFEDLLWEKQTATFVRVKLNYFVTSKKKTQYLLIARIRSRKTQENHQSAKLMTL